MADAPGRGLGGLPLQDPARISDYIQEVVQHNTLASGSKWPPHTAAADHMSTTGQIHAPAPSPGGNVQPSPKDSGVDMNSPTHREDGAHVDPEHEEGSRGHKRDEAAGHCRRDSALVDCVAYGPSSVESGTVIESEAADIDPGGGLAGGGGNLSDVEASSGPCLSSVSLAGNTQQQQSNSSDGEPFTQLSLQRSNGTLNSDPQNIFEKFLMNRSSENNPSLAELNAKTGSAQLGNNSRSSAGSKDSVSKPGSGSGGGRLPRLTSFGDSLHDLASSSSTTAPLLFSSASRHGEHSMESDTDSSYLEGPQGSSNSTTPKPYLYTPAKDLSQLKHTTVASSLNTGLTPPSKIDQPRNSTFGSPFPRTKSSESMGFGGDNSVSGDHDANNLFDIDLLENYEDSDDDREWVLKLESIESVDSGSDMPPVLLPIGPVPKRHDSSELANTRTSSQKQQQQQKKQGFSGTFSSGFFGEFAKFLKKANSTKPKDVPRSRKRNAQSPKKSPGQSSTTRKRHSSSSVSGSGEGINEMLPVLKLRKLSPGTYTAVQSSSQPAAGAEVKPHKLKIKYGSPEMGDRREVIDVHFRHPSSAVRSAAAAEEETRGLSEDEYVLKDSGHEEDRLSSRTLSPPVLHLEPAMAEQSALCSQHLVSVKQEPAAHQLSCQCSDQRTPAGDHFSVKGYMTWHAKVVKLRRKVARLCKVLFPSVTYPRIFSAEGPCVDTLIDQVICAIRDDRESPPPGKPLALPTGDPCCWEVSVVMCKTPKSCLQHLRLKICHLLEALCPDLDLGPSLDRRGDAVDILLHHVLTVNKQRLKAPAGKQKCMTHT